MKFECPNVFGAAVYKENYMQTQMQFVSHTYEESMLRYSVFSSLSMFADMLGKLINAVLQRCSQAEWANSDYEHP